MGRNRLLPRGKKIKPAFFVFCEGETEEQYVKFLRSQYRISIIINSKIAGNRITESYIKHYKKTKFTHQKDKDFLIYDLDAPKILERLQTIDNATLLPFWFLILVLNCGFCCILQSKRLQLIVRHVLRK